MPGELYRTGRRYRRADDQGDCKHKLSKRARKDTPEAKPFHPSLEATYKLLVDPARALESR
jgi:hypothetical protein